MGAIRNEAAAETGKRRNTLDPVLAFELGSALTYSAKPSPWRR